MINLAKEEEEYIFKKNYGNITINNKKYYFKLSSDDDSVGLECAIEDLAKLVDIKCAHYELVNIYGYDYYLSEDIAGTGKFHTAYELGFYDNSLYDIWDKLELRYPSKKNHLLNEIIKIYLFDILLLNNDRNHGNYGFKIVNNEVEDIYIFDNEYALYNGDVVLSSKMNINDELNSKVEMSIPYDMEVSLNDLEYFLGTSSKEYYELFKKMYDTLTPEVVLKVLTENHVVGIRQKINIYRDNYRLIGELLLKRGLK